MSAPASTKAATSSGATRERPLCPATPAACMRPPTTRASWPTPVLTCSMPRVMAALSAPVDGLAVTTTIWIPRSTARRALS